MALGSSSSTTPAAARRAAEERTRLLPDTTDFDDDNGPPPPKTRISNANVISIAQPIAFFGLLFSVVIGAMLVDKLFISRFFEGARPSVQGLSLNAFNDGMQRCRAIEESRKASTTQPTASSTRRNPRFGVLANYTSGGAPTLLKHATVWDGEGGRHEDTDVAIAHGLVVAVGKDLTVKHLVEKARKVGPAIDPEHVKVMELDGAYVTPGLVDQHSHAGAYSMPTFQGNLDGNEIFEPLNPQLRVQDSFNILDDALEFIVRGGVTTSLILPGSGTLMGGEGVAVKMLRAKNNLVEDMTINSGMTDPKDGKKWRWMKMACGENPKGLGAALGKMPMSRMGNGWLFRKRFEEARATMRAQDDWCAAASAASLRYRGNAHWYMTAERFPEPLVDESLVALLRGDVLLQVHCYETHDIEMMVRNTHEFGFKVQAFHHALEAHLVADLLAKEDIAVAIFADHAYYKKEAYGASTKAGQILHEAGAKVAYKSDHPVLNSQHLIFEAQKAVQYGLDEDVAFAAITSVPADRIGQGWRVGRLKPGFDADVLIWDRNPMELGARPLQVYIDGYLVATSPKPASTPKEVATSQTEPMKIVTSSSTTIQKNAPINIPSYTIANVSKIYMDDGVVKSGSIVVVNGLVACVGPKCSSKGEVFDMRGGVVIPGLVGANMNLGLREITQEASTQNGPAAYADAVAGKVRAVDGLHVGGGSKPLRAAFRGGVLHSISVPDGVFVSGLSVAFRTGAELFYDAIVKEVVALHVTVGDSAKSSAATSIASQFAALATHLNATSGPFHDAATGKLPIVVTVHEPSDISRVLNLKRLLHPSMRLVIAGASGAHAVASEIARLDVPVLLLPPRCTPATWELRWCRTVGTGASNAATLARAGVRLLITQTEDGVQRNLLWEAGWVIADSDGAVDENVALGAVTWNVARAFDVSDAGRIVVGGRASLVGINGQGPFGFGKSIQFVADGSEVTGHPEQD